MSTRWSSAAAARFHLARALWAAGQRDRARALGETARAGLTDPLEAAEAERCLHERAAR